MTSRSAFSTRWLAAAVAATALSACGGANDDLRDNFFLNPGVGRFPGIEEDEPALVKLVSE